MGIGGDEEGKPILSLRRRVNMKRFVPKEKRNSMRKIL
jgi:hypothetical protein